MRRVFLVSLSRSDYASTRPVALAAAADSTLDAKLVAGGSHMLKRYGNTQEQIRADGLALHAVADFLSETDDSPAQLAQAYARAVNQFVAIFAEGAPDAIFIVGDRWEMLAVASAASMLQIPVIHHSGGDITQGSSDNQTRYALTCLSHLHLVALPQHRDRLLHMGEEDWRVITTGEPALTELPRFAAAVPDIHAHLGLEDGEPFVLATFHPASFEQVAPAEQIRVFIEALASVQERIILTAPNPDASSELFLQKLREFVSRTPRARLFDSLGTAYYPAMAAARCMIGNSSSGLWEAPSFALPVVNIGVRQQGRVHGANVINVPLDAGAIRAGIATALSDGFRRSLSRDGNPYVMADTLERIMGCLRHPHDRHTLLAKHFIDPLNVPLNVHGTARP
jgi:UDP-hydrolysing UDP-N-acetyl-D-glucosamine 2-epimerase